MPSNGSKNNEPLTNSGTPQLSPALFQRHDLEPGYRHQAGVEYLQIDIELAVFLNHRIHQ